MRKASGLKFEQNLVPFPTVYKVIRLYFFVTPLEKQLTRYLFQSPIACAINGYCPYESFKFRFPLINIFISLHANLCDQVHGDRNSRAHDLFREKETLKAVCSERKTQNKTRRMLRKRSKVAPVLTEQTFAFSAFHNPSSCYQHCWL
ncbi:hypothetical protein VNO77_18319 [Canavalia gladiata]|uniref:Uncharacterized protein n=1 Tax=Canavalia gladiata TaxID=3824 RepID=A0AAN9LQK0_CANGL